jgi:hypothetical protein
LPSWRWSGTRGHDHDELLMDGVARADACEIVRDHVDRVPVSWSVQ